MSSAFGPEPWLGPYYLLNRQGRRSLEYLAQRHGWNIANIPNEMSAKEFREFLISIVTRTHPGLRTLPHDPVTGRLLREQPTHADTRRTRASVRRVTGRRYATAYRNWEKKFKPVSE